jgi:hypothetical protein
MTSIDDIIAAALARNADLTAAAVAASGEVMTAASARILSPAGYVATMPALRNTPPVFTPDADLSTLFTGSYATAFADFDPKVLEAVVDFMARFFPAAVATAVDDWIQNTIVNGYGLPIDVENAIWERARSREVMEATRMEQEAYNTFAARGFLLPPGALAMQVQQVQQDAANKSRTLSRERAVEMAKLNIESVKFAVEQGSRVRIAVIQSVGDYIRAWLAPADIAVRYATGVVDAKNRLWSAAADYYRAMITEAELNVRVQNIKQISRDQMVGYDVQSFDHFVDAQVRGALGVAQVLGQAAAGALNSLGASAALSDQRVGPIT